MYYRLKTTFHTHFWLIGKRSYDDEVCFWAVGHAHARAKAIKFLRSIRDKHLGFYDRYNFAEISLSLNIPILSKPIELELPII